jgi:orotidine-5'-phosphate decarboxylase
MVISHDRWFLDRICTHILACRRRLAVDLLQRQLPGVRGRQEEAPGRRRRRDSAQPFLDRADKGVVVLCRTSNPGSGEFQDLPLAGADGATRPLYQHVAQRVANEWNANGNCLLVVGATWPKELAEVRALTGDLPFLVPGVGAQGGDVEAVLRHGATRDGTGLVISSSRAILYAGHDTDFAAAARRAARVQRDEINRYR